MTPCREPHPMLGINAVGIMQVHNERTIDPKHLTRSLMSLKRICHTVIVYDDGSNDQETLHWLRTVGQLGGFVHHLIEGHDNDWHSEVAHKSIMVEAARALDVMAAEQTERIEQGLEDSSAPLYRRYHPVDWIIWLDADEELSPGAHDEIIEHSQDEGITGMWIKELNLWRDPWHYRVDSSFDGPQCGWFCRVWRLTDDLVYKKKPEGLHKQQYPDAANDCAIRLCADKARVVHYSWDKPEKIDAKNARYMLAGDTKSIARMTDGDHVQLVPAPAHYFWVSQPKWKPCIHAGVPGHFQDLQLGIMAHPSIGFWRIGHPHEVFETEVELLHRIGRKV